MNELIKSVVFLLLMNISVYVKGDTSLSSTANCSPVFSDFYGILIVNCDVNSDDMSEAYKTDIRQMFDDKFKETEIVKKYNEIALEQNKQSKELNLLADELDSIEFKYTNSSDEVKYKLDEHKKHLKGQLDEQKLDFNKLQQEYINIKADLEKNLINVVSNVAKSLDLKVENVTDEFNERLNSQLKNTYEKISADMKLKFDSYKKNKIFIGLSIGTTYVGKGFLSGPILGSDNWPSKLGALVEIPINKMPFLNKKGTLIIEVSTLYWTKTVFYTTLSSLTEQNFEEDNRFTSLAFGSKVFIAEVNETVNFYTGGMLGYSILETDHESTAYFAILFGFDMKFQSVRLDAEIRLERFSKIKERDVVFSPFGNSRDDTLTNFKDVINFNVSILFGL